MNATIVQAKVRRAVELADNKGAQVAVHNKEQPGGGHPAAEAEELLEGCPGEHEAGLPWRGNPHNNEGKQPCDNPLNDDGPVAPAGIGQVQAHGHANKGDAGADDGGGLEIPAAGIQGPVNAGKAVEEHHARGNPGNIFEVRLVEEFCKPGSHQEEDGAHEQAHAGIEPEHGVDILLCAVHLADECLAEPGGGQGGGHGKEDGGKPQNAHFRRGNQAGQHHAKNQLHRLQRAFLEHLPLGTADGFLSYPSHAR